MEYSFLETSDEALIEGAKLPLEKGAAIGMFTTGYDVVNDETVAISIVDMNGSVLFSEKVKPHNREDWSACEASGGIGPEDVEEAQPLYELEDEISPIAWSSMYASSFVFRIALRAILKSLPQLPRLKALPNTMAL